MNPEELSNHYADLLRRSTVDWGKVKPRTEERRLEVRDVYVGPGMLPYRRDVVSDHTGHQSYTMHFDINKSPGAKDALAAYFGITPSRTTFANTTNTEEKNVDRNAIIQSRLAELEAELANRQKFGDDDYVEGTVLKFKADHNVEGGTNYTFAAVKAGGKWYLTGRETTGFTWSSLVDFFISVHVTKMWGMEKAQRLI